MLTHSLKHKKNYNNIFYKVFLFTYFYYKGWKNKIYERNFPMTIMKNCLFMLLIFNWVIFFTLKKTRLMTYCLMWMAIWYYFFFWKLMKIPLKFNSMVKIFFFVTIKLCILQIFAWPQSWPGLTFGLILALP